MARTSARILTIAAVLALVVAVYMHIEAYIKAYEDVVACMSNTSRALWHSESRTLVIVEHCAREFSSLADTTSKPIVKISCNNTEAVGKGVTVASGGRLVIVLDQDIAASLDKCRTAEITIVLQVAPRDPIARFIVPISELRLELEVSLPTKAG